MIKHTVTSQRELKKVNETALKQPHSQAVLHKQPSFLGRRSLNNMSNTEPEFDPIPDTVQFLENSIGPLLNVSATDPDMGSNGEIDYALSVSDSASFSIDSITGQISVSQPLDRETSDVHILTVTASDRGTPPLSTTDQIIVKVIDINDNDPQFTENGYEVSVCENVPQVAFLQIRANDSDRGQNGE